MSKIDYNVLREAAEAAKGKTTWQNLQAFHAVVTPEVVLAMLDVLDAPQDAGPVASCIVENGEMCVDGFGEYVGHSLPDGRHDLYAAPPAPVVPEEISMASKLPLMSDQLMALGYVKGWNACRAAMLKGKGGA